jgi:hypothetical protein
LSDTAIDFLYLSEPDMIAAGVTDMSACVDAMEQTFALLHRGDYRMSGSNHDSHGALINFPDESPFPTMPRNGADRRFMAMPAYLGGDFGTTGVKWYGSNLANQAKGLPRSILMFMLNDTDTGAPLALMSANLLSAYRTGAVPGVGARFLAQPDSRVVGIVGPGVIGRSSLAAFITACPKVDTVVEVAVATTRTVAHRTKELGVLGATECRAHRWWPRCSSSPSSPQCSARSRAPRWPLSSPSLLALRVSCPPVLGSAASSPAPPSRSVSASSPQWPPASFPPGSQRRGHRSIRSPREAK